MKEFLDDESTLLCKQKDEEDVNIKMAVKPHKRGFCVMLDISPIRYGNSKILCVSKGDFTFIQKLQNTELQVPVQNQTE